MPFDDWLIVDDQIVFCTPSTTTELGRQAQHAYEDGADSDAEDGSDASAPADSDRAQKNCYSREKINHGSRVDKLRLIRSYPFPADSASARSDGRRPTKAVRARIWLCWPG